VSHLLLADCSLVSALVDLKCLDRLNRFLVVKHWILVIPDVVLSEIGGKITRRQLESRLKFSVCKSKSPATVDLRARYPSLGDGELAVISSALERRATGRVVAGLDDRIARSVARGLGMKVIGTLGILRLMFETKTITRKELEDHCDSLSKVGFHMTGELLTEILRPYKNAT